MTSRQRIVFFAAIPTAALFLAPPAPAQSTLHSARATNGTETLFFRNGDFIYGKLLEIKGQTELRWRHQDATSPIAFKPEKIAQIEFAAPKPAPAPSDKLCRLLLASGDSVEGDFVSCDRNSIALQTWYAGRLNIPRSSVQSLVFIRPSPAIFDGITGVDGWTQGTVAAGANVGETGNWTYRDGAFYATNQASIARDLKLPDVADIQFDLAWKGGLNLAIAFYTDSLQPILLTTKDQGPEFSGFYSLRFDDTIFKRIDLWPVKKREGFRSLGPLPFPPLNGGPRLHVDLQVNKAQNKIALYLDDKLAKEWVDPDGFIGAGTGMRFVQNTGGAVKLSHLRVAQRWEGILEDIAADAHNSHSEIYCLENGEKVPGTIDFISNGKMTLRSGRGPMEIPVSSIKAVAFDTRPANPPQSVNPTVRATFIEGGTLNFVLESWRPNEMVIRDADLGRATINPAAFTRLEFIPLEEQPGEKHPTGPTFE